MHLGPVTDREADICEIVDGYVSNPLREQSEINRIPLATCADYAYNPRGYDAQRSIGQAILLQAEKPSQREVLCKLVEAYPGMLLTPGVGKKRTAYNPVRAQMDNILALTQPRFIAQAYIASLDDLAARLQTEFPHRYEAEKRRSLRTSRK